MKKILILLLVVAGFTSCKVAKQNVVVETEKPVKEKPRGTHKVSDLRAYCLDWLGTPHRMGGTTKQGVDCSGFVSIVYKEIYGITLPRRSQDMAKVCKIINNKNDLKEGDLVFFNNKKGGTINHVGIFLDKDKFIHTSTSKGVTIGRFSETYWAERFRCGGRHPEKK
ncbi:MAG: C40 family peptidase [Bacteroidales bacterium]|jgi:lipoprotein Spr|nr:C40 family peptidase [Bacteroidales bacterium]